MTMYYSATAGGFYPDGQNYPNPPGDLLEISQSAYDALLVAQGAGKHIVAGVDGVPIAIDPPMPDAATLRATMAPLSRRQVIIGMITENFITEAEGLALATAGTTPAAVEALIAAMPQGQQMPARVTVATFRDAARLDPLTLMFQAAGGLTDTDMDAFFTTYAQV